MKVERAKVVKERIQLGCMLTIQMALRGGGYKAAYQLQFSLL